MIWRSEDLLIWSLRTNQFRTISNVRTFQLILRSFRESLFFRQKLVMTNFNKVTLKKVLMQTLFSTLSKNWYLTLNAQLFIFVLQVNKHVSFKLSVLSVNTPAVLENFSTWTSSSRLQLIFVYKPAIHLKKILSSTYPFNYETYNSFYYCGSCHCKLQPCECLVSREQDYWYSFQVWTRSVKQIRTSNSR